MELNELAAALRSSGANTAKLQGLDEDYATAQALRGSNLAQINQYGTVSPLAVFADVLNRERGNRDTRLLKPQREQLRTDIAEGNTVLPLYNAGKQEEATKQAQTNFDTTTANTLAAAQAKAEEQRRKEKVTAGNRTVVDRVNPDTGTVMSVQQGPNGLLYLDGVEIPNPQDWVKAPTSNRNINISSGGYTDKSANKRAEEAIQTLGRMDSAVGLAKSMSPKTLERLNSVQERAIKAISSALPAEIKQFVATERESDPAVKQYFATLEGLSAEQRHELFGSALTNVENMSSSAFLAAVMTLPIEEQIARLTTGAKDKIEALKIMDRVHGGGLTNYTDSFNSMGYKNLNDTAPAPQGASAPSPTDQRSARRSARIAQLRAEIAAEKGAQNGGE